MKVLVTGTRGIPDIMGGVETHCEELFPRVAAKGIDVIVARRSSYVYDARTVWRGVQLIDIATPKRKALEAIIHTWRAIRYAKRCGTDIVHIHAIGPALLTPYAKMLGLRVVFTHHGPDYDRDKWGRVAKIMLKMGERMGCKYADEVVVISEVIRAIVAEKYQRTEHVHLVYNGVPTPAPCSYPEFFAEQGIAEGKYILAIGRFVPEKNLHHLIEAYAQLRREGTVSEDLRLVIAGDADFEDAYSLSLKQQAKDNNVVMTGVVKGRKLHALLTHAAVFCLPSRHEGLPISLLEAMSYGLPVLVSDIPANRAVGLNDDDYFPCGDIPALATKLSRTLRQPLFRRSYDLSPYNWDTIASTLATIYHTLLEGENPRGQ